MLRHNQVTTVGSLLIDLFMYADSGRVIGNRRNITAKKLIAFERAAKITCTNSYILFGGGAGNCAVTFSRMGLRCGILSSLGNDALGSEYLRRLRGEGVDSGLVARPKNGSTGISCIVSINDARDHVLFVHKGPSPALIDIDRIRTSWIYVTSLSGAWFAGLHRLSKSATRLGLRLVWNPGAEQLGASPAQLQKILSNTYLLIVNFDEAIELLLRLNGANVISPRDLVRSLRLYGPFMVIVTCGHRGAYLFDGTRILYQRAILGKTVNKTGAGDAFGSGFVAGLMTYGDLSKALRVAALNSHSVVGSIGAQSGILYRRQLR